MIPNTDGKSPQYNPEAPVQPIQIIVFALMMGVTVFAVVAVFLNLKQQNPPVDNSAPIVAAALAASAVVARFLIPPIVATAQLRNVSQQRQQNNSLELDQAIYAVFQTRTILEGAILEGAALFSIVVFMFSQQWWLLAIPGVLVTLMLVTFPTKGRIEQFIHDNQQQLEF